MKGSEAGPGRGRHSSSSLAGGAGTVGASRGEVHKDTGATRRPRRKRKNRSPRRQGGKAVCRRAVPTAGQGTGHACLLQRGGEDAGQCPPGSRAGSGRER